jgi:hypothetical protein
MEIPGYQNTVFKTNIPVMEPARITILRGLS